jgi:putative phosphoesterase
MKVAILSDIHGNHFALNEVANDIVKNDIDTVLVAGDTVGYYYGIKQVLEILSNFKMYLTRGNHEEMLGTIMSNSEEIARTTKKYGSSLLLALETLSSSELDMLINSEHPKSIKLDNLHLILAHGSPWDLSLYLYKNSEKSLWKKFTDYPEQVFVIGHTHMQHIEYFEEKIIINPGSVGQNRRCPGIADWAILDTELLAVEFKSSIYSTKKLIEDCKRIDPDVPLLTRMLGDSN